MTRLRSMLAMTKLRQYRRYLSAAGSMALVAAGLFFLFGEHSGKYSVQISDPVARRAFLGEPLAPAERSLITRESVNGSTADYQLATIRHIPRIVRSAPIPHPYVGKCDNCHVFVGDTGPGIQAATRIGQILEDFAKVRKLGPPLRPDSKRPHPKAGRCIKCHDIMIKVPVNAAANGPEWVL